MMEKENNSELIITILFGWLGVHKFMEKETGWGIAYLLTFGLFGIGWIYDIYACIYYRSDDFKKIFPLSFQNLCLCQIHIRKLSAVHIQNKRIKQQ